MRAAPGWHRLEEVTMSDTPLGVPGGAGSFPSSGGGGWSPPPPLPPGPPSSGADRDGPPWERRRGVFDLAALGGTIRDVLIDAPNCFARMKREGGLGGPLLYAVMLGTICGWIAMAWGWLFSEMTAGLMESLNQDSALSQTPFAIPPEYETIFRVLWAVILPVTLVVSLFIMAGIVHLMLLLVGVRTRSFETTFRVAAYGSGSTAVFQCLPFCGGIIGGIWAIVVAIIGQAKAHETDMGRAAAAILIPFALCCLCCIAAFALLAAGFANLASQ
jgi:hypothetical protein